MIPSLHHVPRRRSCDGTGGDGLTVPPPRAKETCVGSRRRARLTGAPFLDDCVGCGVLAWQVQRYGPPRDALRRVAVDEPMPGPGELRLRRRAAAIGLPDALMCRGTHPFSPALPLLPR